MIKKTKNGSKMLYIRLVYISMSRAVILILFVKNLLKNLLNIKLEKPVKLYSDISVAVAIAECDNFTKNSKYIEVQSHYVNENCKRLNINIIKVDSNENIADMFIDSLGKKKSILKIVKNSTPISRKSYYVIRNQSKRKYE